MKYLRNINLFLLIISVLFASEIFGQTIDTRGREFWLTFPPNFHNTGQNQTNLDSIIIFFSAEVPTTVEVEMRDVNRNITRRTINITNPKQVYKTGVKYHNYELRGFKNYLNSGSSNDPFTSQTGKIAPQYFKVTATSDISVYAYSKASLSCDAFLSFPTSGLGKEYLVMSYPNDTFSTQGVSFTPSQFAILAVENNTEVTITPKVSSYNFGSAPKTIILNQGDSYLMQAEIGNYGSKADLTGSEIKSTKNIAVITGQQRANIPFELANSNPSRDILIEQLIPTNLWGRNAFLIPFPTLLNNWKAYDVFRVIVSEDSTVIDLNGVQKVTLNRGEFYEAPLNEIFHIESTAPMMVALYKQSSQDPNSGQNTLTEGDPFMLIIPPKEQFSRIYRCVNIQATQQDQSFGGEQNAYTKQYLTILAPNTALNTVSIDGVAVSPSFFQPVKQSGYSYYIARVSDGTHDVLASEEIGIYVYGFGDVNSYGYIGGMSTKNIDHNPPKYFTTKECFKLNGVIADTLEFDGGIYKLDVEQTKQVNCTVITDYSGIGDKIINFSGQLTDIYQDGSFELNATDTIGYSRKKYFDLPGLTVGLSKFETKLLLFNDSILQTKTICKKFELENYGFFPQTINLESNNKNHTITINGLSSPITLSPKQKISVDVCFDAGLLGDTTITDTILVNFQNNGNIDCGKRSVVAINYYVGKDTESPDLVSNNKDTCGLEKFFTVRDIGKLNTGIKELITIDSNNTVVEVTYFLPDSLVVKYYQRVKNKDASVHIQVNDLVNNSIELKDTIFSSVIKFSVSSSGSGYQDKFNFDSTLTGRSVCDSITIINEGNSAINLGNLRLKNGLFFSLPNSQLPFIIPANSNRSLLVCFNPLQSKIKNNYTYTDSLIYDFLCRTSVIPIIGLSEDARLTGSNRCGLILAYNYDFPKNQFEYYPVPAENELNVKLTLITTGQVEVNLISTLGAVFPLDKIDLNKGSYQLVFDITNIAAGTYLLEVKTNTDKYSGSLQIVK